jgi:hypothetical protein
MNSISTSRKIQGKDVTLIIIFDGEFRKLTELKSDPKFLEKYESLCPDFWKLDKQKYLQAAYSKDFKEFAAYQKRETLKNRIEGIKDEDLSKEEKSKELGEALKQETILKFWNKIKHFETEISFDEFKKTTLSIFSKILFYEIENNPSYIISDSLTIEIKLLHVKDMEFFFYYNHEASDLETACYYCSGLWFIQTIVMPFFMLGKTDFAHIERFIMHEFVHHLDFVKGYLVWDTKYNEKIKKVARKKSAYNINYLYTSLFNLRQEGLADFNARKNSDKLEIDMSGVKEYNEKMIILSKTRLKKYSQSLYEDKISTGNMSASGEYTMGRNMCLTIALATAKRMKKAYILIESNGQTHRGYEFPELNKYLNHNTRIYISELHKDVIAQTMFDISPTVHYYFVKLYEGACDELNIEDKNRIMTSKKFYALVKQAIQTYKDERKQKLLKSGFIDTPTEVIIEDKNWI